MKLESSKRPSNPRPRPRLARVNGWWMPGSTCKQQPADHHFVCDMGTMGIPVLLTIQNNVGNPVQTYQTDTTGALGVAAGRKVQHLVQPRKPFFSQYSSLAGSTQHST